MKNLLIVLGLIATVSSVSANNVTAEKSKNNTTVIASANHSLLADIGGDDRDKERWRP